MAVGEEDIFDDEPELDDEDDGSGILGLDVADDEDDEDFDDDFDEDFDYDDEEEDEFNA
jgi:hypothetical protein